MYVKHAYQDTHFITMYAINATFKIALLVAVPMFVKLVLLGSLFIVELVFHVQLQIVQHATPPTTVSLVLQVTL